MNFSGENKGNPAADDGPSSSKRKHKEDDATESEYTDSATESESASVIQNSGLVSEACLQASDQSVIEDRTSDLDYNVAEIKTEVVDPDYYTNVQNISDVRVKTEPEDIDHGDNSVMQKSYMEGQSASDTFANIKTEENKSEDTLPAPVPVNVVQNFHSVLQTAQTANVEQTMQTGTAEQTPMAVKISLTSVSTSVQDITKAHTVHSGNSEVVAPNTPVHLISGIQPTVLLRNPNSNVFQLVNAFPGSSQHPGAVQLVNTIQPSLQLLNANQNVVQFPTAMPNTGQYFPTMALNQNMAVPPVLAAPAAQTSPIVEHALQKTKLPHILPKERKTWHRNFQVKQYPWKTKNHVTQETNIVFMF